MNYGENWRVSFWKKLRAFPKKLYDYIPVIWNDSDFDYSRSLIVLHFKLSRLRDHIKEHNILLESDRVCREIDEALTLLEAYLDDDMDEKSWIDFFDALTQNAQGWWD